MKFKNYIKLFLIYNIIFAIAMFFINENDLLDKVINYIDYNTIIFKFQDLLSVSITILTILVGAVITVATVLISMCDKRVLKLINQYGKSKYLISAIKISIITGFISVFILAIIYAKLDFNLIYLRLCLLYVCGFSVLVFFTKSKMLLNIVLSLLNDSFKDNNSIIVDSEFKRNK